MGHVRAFLHFGGLKGQQIEESMYVPLRFVSERFGTLIGYDKNTRTIFG